MIYVTRLKRFLEHMTLQYDLNSLQDLTNSRVHNFRNKDNKKNQKPNNVCHFHMCSIFY